MVGFLLVFLSSNPKRLHKATLPSIVTKMEPEGRLRKKALPPPDPVYFPP